jgi:hypothetical protein
MNPSDLKQKLLDETFKAMGLSSHSPLRLLLEPIFAPAAQRFAEVAIRFDSDVSTYGFRAAALRLLPRFIRNVQVDGMERIPPEGPLLVVSNHPGTIDALVIASHLPRPDLKIVVSGVPFLRSLSATAQHLIYTSADTHERVNALRSIIRYLGQGGTVLIFPSGGIDPDPALMPGATDEIETWSPSLDLIVRRLASVNVLITAVGGVLHEAWIKSPFVRIRRGRRNQQRLAEFFQIIQQMLIPNSLLVSPVVSFAEPLRFTANSSSPVLPAIIARAKEHLAQLQKRLSLLDG